MNLSDEPTLPIKTEHTEEHGMSVYTEEHRMSDGVPPWTCDIKHTYEPFDPTIDPDSGLLWSSTGNCKQTTVTVTLDMEYKDLWMLRAHIDEVLTRLAQGKDNA